MTCDGVDGNPVVFAPEYRNELLALSGDVGGKKVLLAHPEEVTRFFGEKVLRNWLMLTRNSSFAIIRTIDLRPI